jgi:hypothetical protein
MRIRKEKRKKLEENRIMGEDPEYEYEWNNFVIVQVIDLDDEDTDIQESGIETKKKEVHYSNLLDELNSSKKQNKQESRENKRNLVNKPMSKGEPKEKEEGTTMYYQCPICFKKIPAKDFNEHYKEELKLQQIQKEGGNKGGDVKPEKEEMSNNVQNYLMDRQNKKSQNEIVFKKKAKPDFLK